MMTPTDQFEDLAKIMTSASVQELQSVKFKQHITNINKITTEIETKTYYINQNIEFIDDDDCKLLSIKEKLNKIIQKEREKITIRKQQAVYLNLFKSELATKNMKFKEKCAKFLSDNEKELKDLQQYYEDKAPKYKEFQQLQADVMKLKIEIMMKKSKIDQYRRNYSLFQDIQKKITQSVIIEFAQVQIAMRKNEEKRKRLDKLKLKENCLIKEHNELLQQTNEIKLSKARDGKTLNLHNQNIDRSSIIRKDDTEWQNKTVVDRLQQFLKTSCTSAPLTTLISSPSRIISNWKTTRDISDQNKIYNTKFNGDYSKVRLLETSRKEPLKNYHNKSSSGIKISNVPSNNLPSQKKLSQSKPNLSQNNLLNKTIISNVEKEHVAQPTAIEPLNVQTSNSNKEVIQPADCEYKQISNTQEESTEHSKNIFQQSETFETADNCNNFLDTFNTVPKSSAINSGSKSFFAQPNISNVKKDIFGNNMLNPDKDVLKSKYFSNKHVSFQMKNDNQDISLKTASQNPSEGQNGSSISFLTTNAEYSFNSQQREANNFDITNPEEDFDLFQFEDADINYGVKKAPVFSMY